MIKKFEQFKLNEGKCIETYTIITTGDGEIRGIYSFNNESDAEKYLKMIVTLIKRLSEADFKEVEGTGDDYFDYGFRYENTKDLTNWECEHGEIVLIRSYDCDGYVKYLHSRLTKKENKHLLK
jgi:hypothetical protein